MSSECKVTKRKVNVNKQLNDIIINDNTHLLQRNYTNKQRRRAIVSRRNNYVMNTYGAYYRRLKQLDVRGQRDHLANEKYILNNKIVCNKSMLKDKLLHNKIILSHVLTGLDANQYHAEKVLVFINK